MSTRKQAGFIPIGLLIYWAFPLSVLAIVLGLIINSKSPQKPDSSAQLPATQEPLKDDSKYEAVCDQEYEVLLGKSLLPGNINKAEYKILCELENNLNELKLLKANQDAELETHRKLYRKQLEELNQKESDCGLGQGAYSESPEVKELCQKPVASLKTLVNQTQDKIVLEEELRGRIEQVMDDLIIRLKEWKERLGIDSR